MAGRVPNALRDQLISSFRTRVCEKLGMVPLVHQAEWWAATDGLTLTDMPDPSGTLVKLSDGATERRMAVPRVGGRAHIIADLGSFKIGKSWGAGTWASAFAAVPGAKVVLVGLEYATCAHEFNYIVEALISGRGMNLPYESYQNRPRDGKLWLDLENGARFEARSWERKDSLKGDEVDCYIFSEAYQLPGIECLTDNSQNLRVRDGYAIFPTTPDRPWVKQLHEMGHGNPEFPECHCTCGVGAEVNEVSFDARAKVRDKALMTREKFAIHYEGKLGEFVGKVFNYQRGGSTFTTASHPELWRDPSQLPSAKNLRVPDGWEVASAADTGTFYTALTVAFSPAGDAFVVAESPNYDYVSGKPERDEQVTIPQWARETLARTFAAGGKSTFWADQNTQFRRELQMYDMTLLANKVPLETRTEIAREYFQHGKIFLAPWLSVLPFELENASWPEEASAAGKFARVKDRDHTLDCLEHILSKRPRGKNLLASKPRTYAESVIKKPFRTHTGDPHLGRFA